MQTRQYRQSDRHRTKKHYLAFILLVFSSITFAKEICFIECEPPPCDFACEPPPQELVVPQTPAQLNVPATDLDGTFNVYWSGVPVVNSVSYVLQEQIDSGSWKTVYQGNSTSTSLSGRVAATYHYRVKACEDECSANRYSSSLIIGQDNATIIDYFVSIGYPASDITFIDNDPVLQGDIVYQRDLILARINKVKTNQTSELATNNNNSPSLGKSREFDFVVDHERARYITIGIDPNYPSGFSSGTQGILKDGLRWAVDAINRSSVKDTDENMQIGVSPENYLNKGTHIFYKIVEISTTNNDPQNAVDTLVRMVDTLGPNGGAYGVAPPPKEINGVNHPGDLIRLSVSRLANAPEDFFTTTLIHEMLHTLGVMHEGDTNYAVTEGTPERDSKSIMVTAPLDDANYELSFWDKAALTVLYPISIESTVDSLDLIEIDWAVNIVDSSYDYNIDSMDFTYQLYANATNAIVDQGSINVETTTYIDDTISGSFESTMSSGEFEVGAQYYYQLTLQNRAVYTSPVFSFMSSTDPAADDDGDGVANQFDQCPNTFPGVTVDANGCEVVNEILYPGMWSSVLPIVCGDDGKRFAFDLYSWNTYGAVTIESPRDFNVFVNEDAAPKIDEYGDVDSRLIYNNVTYQFSNYQSSSVLHLWILSSCYDYGDERRIRVNLRERPTATFSYQFVDGKIRLTASVQDNDPLSKVVYYYWNINGQHINKTDGAAFDVNPDDDGVNEVELYVQNDVGTMSLFESKTFSYTPPISAALSGPTSLLEDQLGSWSVDASGGAGGLTYRWYLYNPFTCFDCGYQDPWGSPVGSSESYSRSFKMFVTAGGQTLATTRTLKVVVEDSQGNKVEKQIDVDISLPELSMSSISGPSSVPSGGGSWSVTHANTYTPVTVTWDYRFPCGGIPLERKQTIGLKVLRPMYLSCDTWHRMGTGEQVNYNPKESGVIRATVVDSLNRKLEKTKSIYVSVY